MKLPLWLALGGAMAQLGCGAATPSSMGPSGQEAPVVEGESPEAKHERLARLARAKRERCQAIGAAIEQTQAPAAIINVGDTAAAEKMAGQLARTADRLEEVEIDASELAPLLELRDQYSETARGMASALREAAGRHAGPEQKAALRDFSRLEPQLHGYLTDLDDYCNAPVK